VIGAPLEWRDPSAQASKYHQRRFQNWDNEYCHGGEGGNLGVAGVGANHCQGGEHEADEQAACVAEIDLRRGLVVAEKADKAANQGQGGGADQHVAVLYGEHE